MINSYAEPGTVIPLKNGASLWAMPSLVTAAATRVAIVYHGRKYSASVARVPLGGTRWVGLRAVGDIEDAVLGRLASSAAEARLPAGPGAPCSRNWSSRLPSGPLPADVEIARRRCGHAVLRSRTVRVGVAVNRIAKWLELPSALREPDERNHRWLSYLEAAAKPVLAPLILGQRRELSANDQRLIAAWACETAFVAMLSSSDEQRAQGYGVRHPRRRRRPRQARLPVPRPGRRRRDPERDRGRHVRHTRARSTSDLPERPLQ
jgi:hypothetical protein